METMSMRFPVFAVLGPLAGCVVFVLLGGGIKGDNAGAIFGVFLPVAWIAGLIPALVAAAIDHLLEKFDAKSLLRWMVTGVAGYAAAYLFALENYFEPEPFRYGPEWGLIGAIPAVLCSFVVSKLHRE
jgi:hypothetical protein